MSDHREDSTLNFVNQENRFLLYSRGKSIEQHRKFSSFLIVSIVSKLVSDCTVHILTTFLGSQ